MVSLYSKLPRPVKPGRTSAAALLKGGGAVLTKGGRGVVGRPIRHPVLALDVGRSLVGATPGLDDLAPLEPVDRTDGPDRVPLSLAVPGADAGIQQSVVEGEE